MIRVRRTSALDGARGATGHVVIVDVFRAFTTAAYCIATGATEIVLLKDAEEALAMKAKDPSLFLTGEIGGRPIPGFDAGNSPSVIETLDLTGRRVVQRTSSGTQGVVAAGPTADEVLLGSIVIAGATIRYLERYATDVTVVATGTNESADADEDRICAEYLEALLLGHRPGPPVIRLTGDDSGWPDWFPRRDAELACELDRFDFALPVHREDGFLVARPVWP